MRARLLITVLLIIAMAMATSGRSMLTKGGAPDTPEQAELTSDEELEARQLALLFVRRFQQTGDFAPLIDELFVPDFAARLTEQKSDENFITLVEPRLFKETAKADLLRFFVAQTSINLSILQFHLAAEYAITHDAQKEESEHDLELEDVLPPEILSLLKTEPALAALCLVETKSEEADKASEEDEEEFPIKSLERWQQLIPVLERINLKLRESLKSLPAWQRAKQVIPDLTRSLSLSEQLDAVDLQSTILDEDFLGCPVGARLICARVQMFHLDLIRVEGRLKILSVSLEYYKIREPGEAARAKALANFLAIIWDGEMDKFISALQSGIDINAKDDDGTTPALEAAMSGHTEMLRMLIERGADVNCKNRFGNFPLLYAAGGGDVEMIELLLSAGADIKMKNDAGWTALKEASKYDLSAKHREVVKLLKAAGAFATEQ